ncbi:hypothetical protein [Carboxylicivirga marina]|uniref:Uncharacterized protein n=1 Tax=Carboxylicivirga marina TaxID=2800988 RepID=A0ABS1HQQ9_9BACT|nr:hypothetical protein [Carboxylicivirga marina]MBK3520002.1 hypothetical protein [Carboxylicivirga marina]
MKTLLVVFVLLAITMTSFAQDIPKYEKKAKETVALYDKICELDEATEKALLPVMTAKHKELMEVKKATPNDKEAIKAVQQKYSKQVRGIIGKENSQKIAEYWQNQKNK